MDAFFILYGCAKMGRDLIKKKENKIFFLLFGNFFFEGLVFIFDSLGLSKSIRGWLIVYIDLLKFGKAEQ